METNVDRDEDQRVDQRLMMGRRGLFGLVGAAAGAAVLAGCSNKRSSSGSATTTTAAGSSTTAASTATGALAFDPSKFTELTTSVTTSDGTKEVTYNFFKAVTYVANPVDAKYQSLVVSVPTKVDGKAIDASNAPILFVNNVGGYMPSSVADAAKLGSGGAGAMGAPPAAGAMPSGAMPSGASGMMSSPMSLGQDSGSSTSDRASLALAAGCVVIEAGCRGRTLVDSKGVYYGVAPAAIVDLKAAVRYVRANKGKIPGDVDKIVTCGTSAGGALSSLLGASGDVSVYDSYLKELGAADASDAVFATGAWCPIIDLEHADAMYEWNWGSNALASGSKVDQTVSEALRSTFAEYEKSLGLTDGDAGTVTAENLGDVLTAKFVEPAATTYLAGLSESERTAYLTANPFITWANGKASFTWADFLTHVGARKKDAPAFDAFDLSSGENNLFGHDTTMARHFTLYSLRHADGSSASLDKDIPELLNLMNPMYHLAQKNDARAKHWWIRVGTKDTDTALSVVGNLSMTVDKLGDKVNTAMYWDAGHGTDNDPEAFVAWIKEITA